MGSNAEYGGAAHDRVCMQCILTKCFVYLPTLVSTHIHHQSFACLADALEFPEAARMLSKSGSTQFPGEGNAIAYAVQDSTSASDMLQSILLIPSFSTDKTAPSALNLQELLRNQPAGPVTRRAGHLAPFRFTRRPVGDLDIKIKIAYCGICHTDLHQMRNDWKNSTYPMVPGCALSCLRTRTHEHEVLLNAEPYELGWTCSGFACTLFCPAKDMMIRITMFQVLDMCCAQTYLDACASSGARVCT